jgi:hypothetical protein
MDLVKVMPNCLKAAAADVLDVIMSAISTHTACSKLVERCCGILIHVAKIDGGRAAVAAGALQAVITSLSTHAMHEGVRCSGFMALAAFMPCVTQTDITRAIAAGAFGALTAAMRTPCSSRIATTANDAACKVLGWLSQAHKTAAADAGACEALVYAMRAYPADAHVQANACIALSIICSGRADLAARARAAGAVGAVDAALAAFPDATIGVAVRATAARDAISAAVAS